MFSHLWIFCYVDLNWPYRYECTIQSYLLSNKFKSFNLCCNCSNSFLPWSQQYQNNSNIYKAKLTYLIQGHSTISVNDKFHLDLIFPASYVWIILYTRVIILINDITHYKNLYFVSFSYHEQKKVSTVFLS